MPDSPHNPYSPPPLPQGEERTSGHSIAPLKNPTIHSRFAITTIAVTTVFIVAGYAGEMSESSSAGFGILGSSYQHYFDYAGLAFMTAIVSVCMWIYRCAWNARQLAGTTSCSAPGWCVGSYFVPIANLFVPYLCMREIAACTFRHPTQPGVKQLLLPWWLCCLYPNFVVSKENRPDVWDLSALVSLVGAAVLLSLIIHRITKAQVALSMKAPAESQTPPPRAHETPPPHTTLPDYQQSPR